MAGMIFSPYVVPRSQDVFWFRTICNLPTSRVVPESIPVTKPSTVAANAGNDATIHITNTKDGRRKRCCMRKDILLGSTTLAGAAVVLRGRDIACRWSMQFRLRHWRPSRLLVNHAALHHEIDLLKHSRILQRISWNGHHVGIFSRLQCAHLLLHPHQLRCGGSGGT